MGSNEGLNSQCMEGQRVTALFKIKTRGGKLGCS